jgi:hypothetical protein
MGPLNKHQRHMHPPLLHTVVQPTYGPTHLIVANSTAKIGSSTPVCSPTYSQYKGPYSIDRFTSMKNTHMPRFNARLRDPKCDDVDYLHIPADNWRREKSYCKPPRGSLPALTANLRQFGATTTIGAPKGSDKPWFQHLNHTAAEIMHSPPPRNLFFLGRLGKRVGVGRPSWSVLALRLPRRRGYRPAAAL